MSGKECRQHSQPVVQFCTRRDCRAERLACLSCASGHEGHLAQLLSLDQLQRKKVAFLKSPQRSAKGVWLKLELLAQKFEQKLARVKSELLGQFGLEEWGQPQVLGAMRKSVHDLSQQEARGLAFALSQSWQESEQLWDCWINYQQTLIQCIRGLPDFIGLMKQDQRTRNRLIADLLTLKQQELDFKVAQPDLCRPSASKGQGEHPGTKRQQPLIIKNREKELAQFDRIKSRLNHSSQKENQGKDLFPKARFQARAAVAARADEDRIIEEKKESVPPCIVNNIELKEKENLPLEKEKDTRAKRLSNKKLRKSETEWGELPALAAEEKQQSVLRPPLSQTEFRASERERCKHEGVGTINTLSVYECCGHKYWCRKCHDEKEGHKARDVNPSRRYCLNCREEFEVQFDLFTPIKCFECENKAESS